MNFLSRLLCLAALAATAHAARPAFDVTAYGAVGDGATVATGSIQRTIDACAAAGGGAVVVPPGVFLSGALYFKPGVDLEVRTGAVLKSTTNLADFPPVYTSWEGVERYWTSGLLNFIGMTEVSVSGGGTIDGSGLAWGGPRRPLGPRPRRDAPAPAPAGAIAPPPSADAFYHAPLPGVDRLCLAPDPAHLPPVNAAGIPLPGAGGRLSPPRTVVFQDCAHVRVSNLTVKNQARWGVVFIYCRGVEAENLNIHTESYIPSSDGIDVCSCADVRIHGCDISCNDDNITIKAGKDADGLRVDRPSEHITISDCVFGSGGGVAMGSEVSGSVRHVVVERCRFTGTGTAARIKSQPSRGGVVEDIVFRDLQLTDVARAVEFDVEWRMVPPLPPPAKVLTGLRDVRLIRVNGTARAAGIVRGFPARPIEGLSFEACSLQTP
ncbi:MAG TPA: glycosyl hydrolase family 28 protein, partial [Opitutaceae bacterium]|nr:glycosyl hydrolase family 28 protein [Opitutaceae bacterium]